jgi:hypothetical protein
VLAEKFEQRHDALLAVIRKLTALWRLIYRGAKASSNPRSG